MLAINFLLKGLLETYGIYQLAPGVIEAAGYLLLSLVINFFMTIPLTMIGVYSRPASSEGEASDDEARVPPVLLAIRGVHAASLNVLPVLMFGAQMGAVLRAST